MVIVNNSRVQRQQRELSNVSFLLGRVSRAVRAAVASRKQRRLTRSASHPTPAPRRAFQKIDPPDSFLVLWKHLPQSVCGAVLSTVRAACASVQEATSAGSYEQTGWATLRRIAILAQERFECDLSQHRSRLCDAEMVRSADMVFVMDREKYEALATGVPVAIEKTFFLGVFGESGVFEIADPYLMTVPEQAANCLQQIVTALQVLNRMLRNT